MRKKLKLLFICNIIFLIYYLHYILFIPQSVLSIVINLMIFIIPGYSWALFFREKVEDFISFIFLTICMSSVILILGCLFFHFSKIKLSSINMLIFLFLLTNIGLLFLKKSEHISNEKFKIKHFIFIFLLSIFIYLILYVSATRFIPPLEDHDMETQGTAYGIMHYLKPYMVTNRGTVYFFAHPLSLHFYIGNSALFLDQLDDLYYYYQSAVSAEKEFEKKNFMEILMKNWRRDLRKFFSEPHLLLTRMSNIFFSTINSFILFYLLYIYTNSFIFSIIGPIIYFTFPEIFVRSSYGGYNAITNFSLSIMAYFYICKEKIKINSEWKVALIFLSGFVGALTDQKIVILVIAVVIREFFNKNGNIWDKLRAPFSDRIIQGYISGTMLFWAYGFLVSPKAFFKDHITNHIAKRFSLEDVRFVHSKTIWYPSIVELWKEFNNHLGFPFLLVSIPLTIYTLRNIKDRKSILGVWFLTGAILFSITDWRQTKHLMLIILPLIISTLLFISRTKFWLKMIFLLIFTFLIYNNIEVIIKLSKDFTAISPTPIW